VSHMTNKIWIALAATALVVLHGSPASAAAPGITGGSATALTVTFNLNAQQGTINQPDGAQVYSWGYGCSLQPSAAGGTFVPAAIKPPDNGCPLMQIPGPTLVVTEGQTVNVILTNNLPTSAGNTSILFPGFQLTSTANGVTGLLTQEAAPGGTVTYTFIASSPGTRSYYSGTQSDLQVEMGLYGAIIVLPKNVPPACTNGSTNGPSLGFAGKNGLAESHWTEKDFRLAAAAYDHPKTCYDREYLFQFSEMDVNIHKQASAQVTALAGCTAGAPNCRLEVPTEPYHPGYFLINGRSMPDDMDANYGAEYPNQPYNGNPHMHPGEQTLIRVIGQGRWQHPFHQHGNHVRILARDGNLIVSPTDTIATGGTTAQLAGRLEFTTTTTPGQAFDGIFYWTGRGLNWDAYAHNPTSKDPNATLPCTPDLNGYNTLGTSYNQINYFEWCQDHNKPLQAAPFGDVAGGGPATLPDANIFTNGAWYSGSPYLGPNATTRATGPTSSFQPSNTQANPSNERGYAFMWHSHNEREITTNNLFPGGMFMMMLVDSREFVIDESN
jgi:FtsP/CotA-like multicopper oxidase with cupredoxin domain